MTRAAGELCQVLDSTRKAPYGHKSRGGSAIEAARVWATVEDHQDIAEALLLDEHEILTEEVNRTAVPDGCSARTGGKKGRHLHELIKLESKSEDKNKTKSVSDDRNADGNNESTGFGSVTAPPSYAQLSSNFGLLESFAES